MKSAVVLGLRPDIPGRAFDMERNMSRILVLTAASFCLIVTLTVQGQEQGRQGGGRGQQAVALPDGAGKEMVQGMCAACHNLNTVTNSTGFTQERWKDLISTMMRLPEAQQATITQYLAT